MSHALRTALVALAASISFPVLAEQTVHLELGSSVVLRPDVETRVTCADQTDQRSNVICTCRWNNTTDTVDIVQVSVSTNVVLGYLQSFPRSQDALDRCRAAIRNEPYCAR